MDTQQYKQKKQQELKETLDVLDKKIEETRKKWSEENDPEVCKGLQKSIDLTEDKRSHILEELEEIREELKSGESNVVSQKVEVKGTGHSVNTAGGNLNIDTNKKSGKAEIDEITKNMAKSTGKKIHRVM